MESQQHPERAAKTRAPLAIDARWLNDVSANRAPGWDAAALLMDTLGGGLVGTFLLPAVITIALLLARRPWAAGFYLAVSLATGAAVQLLKHFFGRDRPDNVLTNLDFGSFPSGHDHRRGAASMDLGGRGAVHGGDDAEPHLPGRSLAHRHRRCVAARRRDHGDPVGPGRGQTRRGASPRR
jgi:hypothetical protein